MWLIFHLFLKLWTTTTGKDFSFISNMNVTFKLILIRGLVFVSAHNKIEIYLCAVSINVIQCHGCLYIYKFF